MMLKILQLMCAFIGLTLKAGAFLKIQPGQPEAYCFYKSQEDVLSAPYRFLVPPSFRGEVAAAEKGFERRPAKIDDFFKAEAISGVYEKYLETLDVEYAQKLPPLDNFKKSLGSVNKI